MSTASWAQFGVLVGLLMVSTPLLGRYVAQVFSGDRAPAERIFGPIERAIFRMGRVDEEREQRWTTYAYSLLAFSVVSGLFLYALQQAQSALPLNPDGQGPVPSPLAFNTAVSFLTNTNWQNYAGESTMSHLTQMLGLTVQNFVSAASGLVVAIALIRGLTRKGSDTIGNFWVDLVRSVVRILLPLSFLFALVLGSQGVVQNLDARRVVTTTEGTEQVIPGGQVASQEAIKELGQNGGGPFNANSAHPFENPTTVTNLLEVWAILALPFALAYAFGKLVGDRRQGFVVVTVMASLWIASSLLAMHLEVGGSQRLANIGVDQSVTAVQGGGNMEGKDVRFGSAGCGLFAAATTSTSTGAVNCMHDSMTPLCGAVVLVNMMIGEISPGGTGSGLYGMLVFVILSVFLAGLMVGRTPEYLGKKIQATEMKLIALYILFVPIVVLTFTGVSLVMSSTATSLLNDGPHGLTEMTYAFTSAANNNGSAFGGLTGNTDWFNTTLGVAMLVGRFSLMVTVLALAGSLARKHTVPVSAGTFPTGTPLFATLLLGVIVIVVGLTYFPTIALGPVVEHLGGGF